MDRLGGLSEQSTQDLAFAVTCIYFHARLVQRRLPA